MANCVEAVLKYLVSQNRPYSATDITQNMHKEFGKAAIQKALDQLAERKRITEKINGKQKVYCALQEDAGEGAAKELEELDAQIANVTENLRSVEQQYRESESLLKELEATPTTDQAAAEVAALEELLQRLRTKLADLTENCVKVSPQERKQIQKAHETVMKEYRKRKRICNDMISAILEGCPMSKKALMEDIGIETDEDVGVKL